MSPSLYRGIQTGGEPGGDKKQVETTMKPCRRLLVRTKLFNSTCRPTSLSGLSTKRVGHWRAHRSISRGRKMLHSLVSIQGPLGYEPNTLPLRQSARVMSSLRTKTSLKSTAKGEIKIHKQYILIFRNLAARADLADLIFSCFNLSHQVKTDHGGLSPSGALRPAGISCAGDSFGLHRPCSFVLFCQ